MIGAFDIAIPYLSVAKGAATVNAGVGETAGVPVSVTVQNEVASEHRDLARFIAELRTFDRGIPEINKHGGHQCELKKAAIVVLFGRL
jgi:hypothetical protein